MTSLSAKKMHEQATFPHPPHPNEPDGPRARGKDRSSPARCRCRPTKGFEKSSRSTRKGEGGCTCSFSGKRAQGKRCPRAKRSYTRVSYAIHQPIFCPRFVEGGFERLPPEQRHYSTNFKCAFKHRTKEERGDVGGGLGSGVERQTHSCLANAVELLSARR